MILHNVHFVTNIYNLNTVVADFALQEAMFNYIL